MIKNIVTLFTISILLLSCKSSSTISKNDEGIIKGEFSRSVLETDEKFSWFKSQYSTYQPDENAIHFLDSTARNYRFLVFLGTWCGDSKNGVPKFCKIADVSHISQENIILYGLDRTKKSDDGLTEKYHITNVPTVIVLMNDNEIGRITEHPQESFEKDLVRIINYNR